MLPSKTGLGKENELALKAGKVHFQPPDDVGVLYFADASRERATYRDNLSFPRLECYFPHNPTLVVKTDSMRAVTRQEPAYVARKPSFIWALRGIKLSVRPFVAGKRRNRVQIHIRVVGDGGSSLW